jgi:phosphoribosyl 1,2-cyclic phosphodiesterase
MTRLRFSSLGSGSRGNATLVAAGDTMVMVDCGFSLTEVERRLARLEVGIQALTAILVTHEHGDHVCGVARVAARSGAPVYATHGTSTVQPLADKCDTRRIRPGERFEVQDLEISAFAVPHDAREPVQFRFSNGDRRVGVLTDAGHVTRHMIAELSGCDALFVESNHDRDMLAAGPYHAALKVRVGSDYGHLSNDQAADLVRRLDGSRLQHVAIGHLSEQNNTRSLARNCMAQALGCEADWIELADQRTGLDWREVR